ncbi:MAG: SRPBCC family protein [Planctomycetota bacterium]
MPIRFEHAEPSTASQETTFALMDDLSRTAEWLPPCVSLTNTTRGVGEPNQPGDALHYVFKQGGKQQEMTGQILEREEPSKLIAKYTDKAFDVVTDLRVEPSGNGCITHHVIEITPKAFFGKLLSPLIKLGLKGQTRTAAANLRALAES